MCHWAEKKEETILFALATTDHQRQKQITIAPLSDTLSATQCWHPRKKALKKFLLNTLIHLGIGSLPWSIIFIMLRMLLNRWIRLEIKHVTRILFLNIYRRWTQVTELDYVHSLEAKLSEIAKRRRWHRGTTTHFFPLRPPLHKSSLW